MKRQIVLATMLSLVAAVIVTAAAATASAHPFIAIRVDVPFDFSDGSTVFPAGMYTISPVGTGGTAGILITGEQSKIRAIHLAFNAGPGPNSDQATVVFRRHGQQYFVYQVWSAGDSVGLELPRSPMERKRELVGAATDGHSELEIVTIAAAPAR